MTEETGSLSLPPSGLRRSGILFGMGNALLDLCIIGDEDFLEKHGLEANTIHSGPTPGNLHDDLIQTFPDLVRVPGGSVHNSIRVAQWILGTKHATSFLGGCIGEDDSGLLIEAEADRLGVNAHYQKIRDCTTGVVATIVTGHHNENRSMCGRLGAAKYFTDCKLEDLENWGMVKKAKVICLEGFTIPCCFEGMLSIARFARDNHRTLTLNVGSSSVCEQYTSELLLLIPFVDIVFANAEDATFLCKLMKLPAMDISRTAAALSLFDRVNGYEPRTVVLTNGPNDIIVSHKGAVKSFEVPRMETDVKDTSGAGDAFCGGFLAQWVLGKSLDECVSCGIKAAQVIIQQMGCQVPTTDFSSF